jgi:endonuclease YncB( thermonuclease family)
LLFILLAVFAGLVAHCAWWFAPAPGRFPVKLVRVSDGDTVVLQDARARVYKVRLCGIDTPELGVADGFRAALRAAELLESARRIELEPQLSKPRLGRRALSRDKYGRCLGWVWVIPNRGAELLLNEELLRSGMAGLYENGGSGEYAGRLRRAARR